MGHARGRTPSHRRCAAAQARPCRGGHAAAWHRPARATVPFDFALCTLTVTIAPGFERHTARTRPRRWTSPSRTARAAASVSLSLAEPSSVPRVVYPFTYTLPDPIPARIKPRSTEIGEVRRAPCRAAAEQRTPVTCAAAPAPFALDRQILDQRARLDLNPSHNEPLDLDPMVWIQAYRFGLALFLKRPPVLLISTRTPL